MLYAKKILITGASGFIGRSLCNHLSRDNNVIACLNNKEQSEFAAVKKIIVRLPDQKFKQLVEQEKPDYLLHCAGSASIGKSFESQNSDFANNVVVTQFVLDTLKECSQNTKMVFFSSAAVYGNPSRLPIDSTTVAKPISPYGYNKLICEQLCEQFHNLFGLAITTLRIFSVYGPGLKKQILWDIYQKSKTHETITLYGTGKETRDFIYIDDFVKVVFDILENSSFNANIINVGTGITININTLAGTFLKLLGKPIPILFTGTQRPGDPSFWELRSEIQNSIFRKEWTSLESGLNAYISWIKKGAN